MSQLHSVLESPTVHRLGLALLHSLWQGVAVMPLLAVCLAVLRRRSAQSRYLSLCLGLSAMAALPVVTYLLTPAPARAPGASNMRTPPPASSLFAEPME